MKKVTLILAALALVLGISQCKKQEPAHIGEKQHIMLTANNGNDGSKVNVTSATTKLNLTWESTDKINVSGAVEGTLDLTGEPGSATAKFEGTVTRKTGDQVVFTVGSQPNYYMNQDGTLEGTDGLKSRICLKGTSGYEKDGEYSTLMKLQYAVLKLDLSAFGTANGTVVTISNASGIDDASVTGITAASKVVYVALPAASNFTFTSTEGKTVTKENWTLAANKFYTLQGTTDGSAIVIEPAPQGHFTVGMDGSTPRKVEFAPGNLYYDGSAFRFEANQWSFSSTWNVNHVSLFKWSDATDAVKGDNSYSGGQLFCASNFTVSGDSHKWRTLTDAEWKYLLGKSNPCRDNAASLCEWKELDNKTNNGLVILPDGTENPSAVMSDIKSTSDLATYGAVFLPATGQRQGTGVENVGAIGIYWSSTGVDDNDAYRLNFYSGSVYTSTQGRSYGYSLRLVR